MFAKSKLSALLSLSALSLLCMVGVARATAVASDDVVILSLNGTQVSFTPNILGYEVGVGGTATGFHGGTLFLTEPANEPADSTIQWLNGVDVSQYRISDVLNVQLVDVFRHIFSFTVFASDSGLPVFIAGLNVATALLVSDNFLAETGSLQDVSSHFGLTGLGTPNYLLVQSDASPVPIPAALPLFGGGLGLLGLLSRRRRRPTSEAVA